MAASAILTFTRKNGTGPASVVFQHRESALGGPPSNGKIWSAFEVTRDSGWRLKNLAGFSGADAQFFGGDPIVYVVHGYVVSLEHADLATGYANLQTDRDVILRMAGSNTNYNVDSGPFVETDPNGALIIRNVRFEKLGDAARHRFTFEAVVLRGKR